MLWRVKFLVCPAKTSLAFAHRWSHSSVPKLCCTVSQNSLTSLMPTMLFHVAHQVTTCPMSFLIAWKIPGIVWGYYVNFPLVDNQREIKVHNKNPPLSYIFNNPEQHPLATLPDPFSSTAHPSPQDSDSIAEEVASGTCLLQQQQSPLLLYLGQVFCFFSEKVT